VELAAERDPLRKISGFAVVALLHIGIVYALVSGLGRQVIEVLHPPVMVDLIHEAPPPPPQPQLRPPPPKIAALPPAYVPPPEIAVTRPAPPTAITQVTNEKPAEPVPLAAAPAEVEAPAPVHTAAVIDAARSCEQPSYPAASRRLEESGTVVLQFLIDTDGRVVDRKVERSSGFTRLDDAALTALSKCLFKPATTNGRPEQSWARLRYTWKLD